MSYVPFDVIGALGIADGETATEDSRDDWDDIISAVLPYCEHGPRGAGVQEVSVRLGWGARLSAPGYMDHTEWSIFDTEQEALDYLRDELGSEGLEDDD